MKKTNSKIWVISHSMSKGLQHTEDGYQVSNPIMDFIGLNKVNLFHSLDCFVCRKGKYSVLMRIVHLDSGTIVQGIDPFVIEATCDWYTYSYTVGWQYEAALEGLHEYQILVNGKQIGAFRFVQHEKTE
jgi:hypothetical protein